MTVLEQVREVASDVFGLSPSEVTEGTSPENVESWDSVQHLNLVLALESRFGVQFAPEEIEKLKSVGAAAALIATKIGSA